jgi:uncharacterized protein (TIGR03067 family)
MRRLAVTVLAVGLCLTAAAPAADKEKKTDADRMQGTWQTVKMELSGMTLPDEVVNNLKFVIKGDKAVVMGVPDVVKQYAEMTFKIDASTTPKSIDFKIAAGDNKGDEVEAIYEFKGEDEIKICGKLVGKERPGEFSTKEGDNRVVAVLKREKK